MTIESLALRYEQLKADRAPWETLWQEIGTFCSPRRQYNLGGTVTPSTEKEARLFDTTAITAAETLANGQLAWMSPMETAWFAFEPGDRFLSEAAKRYYTDCTARTRKKLSTSNFYTSIHEFYLDRGTFGTAALFVEPGRKSPLNVQHWPVGTYVIDCDYEGNVDTVHREHSYTLRQLVSEFGLQNLSDKLQKAAATDKQWGEKFAVVVSILPREERDKSKIDAANMPYACIFWEVDTRHKLRETGYEEMPVFVSRYLEWGSVFGSMYGWSPAFMALPNARQLNFLQKMMDALAEKMAFPPMMAPEELEGEIDANANGVTYFSSDLAGRLPQPLQRNERYDIGLQRVEERQKAIEKAFHVDLFQMFAQLEKQMTAREISARETEKLIQFSPTFARLTTELFNPCLQRLFGIGLRNGWYGEPPKELLTPISDTLADVAMPEVTYSSRIALALRSLPAMAYYRTLERVSMIAPLYPEVLDNYDFDKAERETSLADGVPPEYMAEEEDVAAVRQARADAAQAQQQMDQAAVAAEAAAKLGQVPQNSPVGEALRGASRQATTPGIPTV